jgi:protein-tyrosine phosphatase
MSLRHIAVPGTYNVRDLGGYATPSGHTRWRRILRADGLHRMKDEGVAQLHALGVATVIDLRRGHELQAGPNPFREHDGVRYVHISLFDALAHDQIAAAETASGNLLLDLYCQALAEQQKEIAAVLTAIAEAGPGLVLFHCTAGKDRTGLIAALLLALAGVAEADIVEDYALTKAQIAPLLAPILAHAEARGENMAHYKALLECEEQTMRDFLAHLAANHGDTEAYLAKIGIDAETAARLRARLLDDAETV